MSDSPVCAKCFDAHRRAINRENRWATGAERERCAKLADAEAERIKHTSHKDGLGMGDSAKETVCHVLSAAIRGLGDEGETS